MTKEQLATRETGHPLRAGDLGARTPHAFYGREFSDDRTRAFAPRARAARGARGATQRRDPIVLRAGRARCAHQPRFLSAVPADQSRSRATSKPGVPILIGGDFNCWRPLLRVFLPGWKTLARGRTWPTPHPHSQIDHILGRGPWVSLDSFTREGGSDHRALIADIELR